ncbi:MAG: hypothetical protein HFG75_13675 [Hungatella sp.]|nr:hypothetical protein [Hungatella sp.]
MKKALLTMGITAMLSCAAAITAMAGWQQEGDKYRYQFDTGSYARSQMVDIEGVRYAFDESAYMVVGWYKENSNWYYFSQENAGGLHTGWRQIDGQWYYLDPGQNGAMRVSWLDIGSSRYYLRPDGSMVTGSFDVDGSVYFAEASGVVRRKTQITENGITIRYDDDGKEWYKNAENEVNHKGGGDLWLPVLPGEALTRQRESIQEDNQYLIQEQKELLYEEYKEKVQKASYKTRENKRIKWEEKVRKTLGEKYYVSEQEIAEFIAEVKSSRYDSDDFYNDDEEEETEEYYWD